MRRRQRLKLGRKWLKKYTGDDVVAWYRQRFHVDQICALIELQKCGASISDEQIEAERHSIEQRCAENNKRKRALMPMIDAESDEHFAYIAGYTEGGTPFGLTWEEWEGSDRREDDDSSEELYDPFAE